MLQLEIKLKDVRDVAIKTTKKMVTEKLDAEYKELFESILKHMNENAEVSSKIQNKINEMKVVEELSESVNGFLDEHVEEILPKKDIVDYERMQKLEQIHESLKNMLGVEIMKVEGRNKEQGSSMARRIQRNNRSGQRRSLREILRCLHTGAGQV